MNKSTSKSAAAAAAANEETEIEKVSTQPSTFSDARSVIDINEFKRNRQVKLTSGFVVEVRRISMPALLTSGKIPNSLMSAAIRIIEGEMDQAQKEADAATPERRLETLTELSQTLDAMAIAVVAYPPLVMTEEEETDDTVWVGRFPDYDKIVILQLAQAGLSTLANFRPEPAS